MITTNVPLFSEQSSETGQENSGHRKFWSSILRHIWPVPPKKQLHLVQKSLEERQLLIPGIPDNHLVVAGLT